MRPSHFHFKDVVPLRDNKEGGWRAACLHVGIMRDTTSELVYCRIGVEVPIKNGPQGFTAVDVAQSRAAHCANEAAWTTLMAATPTTPIAVACEEFRSLFDATFKQVIFGSSVVRACYAGVKPVVLTPSPGASTPR